MSKIIKQKFLWTIFFQLYEKIGKVKRSRGRAKSYNKHTFSLYSSYSQNSSPKNSIRSRSLTNKTINDAEEDNDEKRDTEKENLLDGDRQSVKFQHENQDESLIPSSGPDRDKGSQEKKQRRNNLSNVIHHTKTLLHPENLSSSLDSGRSTEAGAFKPWPLTFAAEYHDVWLNSYTVSIAVIAH